MHPLAHSSLPLVLSIFLAGCSAESSILGEDASAKDAPHEDAPHEDATADTAQPSDALPHPDQIVDRLHLHDKEGLAFSDHSSVITIHECPGDWSWDTVTWTHRAPGAAWTTPGGDASRLVVEIHADADMHKLGFNKAAPNGFFDITAHLQLLQSER